VIDQQRKRQKGKDECVGVEEHWILVYRLRIGPTTEVNTSFPPQSRLIINLRGKDDLCPLEESALSHCEPAYSLLVIHLTAGSSRSVIFGPVK
jgi:hypothetical protein